MKDLIASHGREKKLFSARRIITRTFFRAVYPRQNLHHCAKLLEPSAYSFVMGCALFVGVGVAAPSQVIVLRTIVDSLSTRGTVELPFLVALFVGIGFLGGALAFIATALMGRVGAAMGSALQDKMFERLMFRPIQFYGTVQSGTISTRLTSDLTLACTVFTLVVPALLSGASALVFTSVAIGLVDLRLLLLLVLFPLAVVLVRRIEARIDENLKFSFEQLRRTSVYVERFMSPGSIVLVRQMGRTESVVGEARKTHAELARSEGLVETWKGASGLVYTVTFVIASAVVLLGGVALVDSGTLTIGVLVMLALFTQQLQSPFQHLLGTRYPIIRSRRAFLRIEPVLRAPERPNVVSTAPPTVATSVAGAFTVRSLSYTYPTAEEYVVPTLSFVSSPVQGRDGRVAEFVEMPTEEKQAVERQGAISDITFELTAGSTLGIVGRSGAGKSTLVGLLSGVLSPTSGVVSVDGRDLQAVSENERSSLVSAASQEDVIFNASIAENLRFASPEASDEFLLETLALVGLDEVVARAPEGLDLLLGERGFRLSGGERQRLAVARLLVKSPRVAILDEPTAHLDYDTEARMMRVVRESVGTLVVVAHRLQTVRGLDHILVLDHGHVIEFGAPDELLERSTGKFRTLWDEYTKEQGGSS